MKKLIYIILFISNIAFGQESMLYNSNRKLNIDTTIQINEHSYNNLHFIEKALLPRIYHSLEYPEISRENNQQGIVIVKIIADEQNNFAFEIAKPTFNLLENEVIIFFENIPEYIVRQISPDEGEINIFIPIIFEIDENYFLDKLKQKGAVSIEVNGITKETHFGK